MTHRNITRPAKNPAQKQQYIKKHSNALWLFGYHAVCAALQNPKRSVFRLLLSKETMQELPQNLIPENLHCEIVQKSDFDNILPKGVVHQGIAAYVSTLPEIHETDLIRSDKSVIIILDQVTDPHNVGAILRSAAAFNADGVVMTQKYAPDITGTLAKAASGALEIIPLVTTTNLARYMNTLKQHGYWCVGMDGKAENTLREMKLPRKIALIMGSEGYGLRRLTAQNCDFFAKLPISERIESLNVSNAAAIALYELKYKLTDL